MRRRSDATKPAGTGKSLWKLRTEPGGSWSRLILERAANGGVPVDATDKAPLKVAKSYWSAPPPRNEVFPSPKTSQAKPNRGLKFFFEGFTHIGPTVNSAPA